MARLPFSSCFREEGRKLYFIPPVRVNGVTIHGERIEASMGCGGINWELFKNRDLDVRTDKNTGDKVILGIF